MTDRDDMGSLSDDELLAALGRALEAADPVPPAVTEYAVAGFGWRTIDAELAELVFDSQLAGLTGVRGDEDTREVTFRAPGVELEVMVVAGDTRRMVGQLVPPREAEIQLGFDGDTRSTWSDETGRFTFDDVPSGRIRLRCRLGDDQVVQTEWLVM